MGIHVAALHKQYADYGSLERIASYTKPKWTWEIFVTLSFKILPSYFNSYTHDLLTKLHNSYCNSQHPRKLRVHLLFVVALDHEQPSNIVKPVCHG